MSNTKPRFGVWYRKPRVLNLDPHRRVYNGQPFSSKLVWTEWELIYPYVDEESAESARQTFQKTNPNCLCNECMLSRVGLTPEDMPQLEVQVPVPGRPTLKMWLQ